jgi:hypothetical protein
MPKPMPTPNAPTDDGDIRKIESQHGQGDQEPDQNNRIVDQPGHGDAHALLHLARQDDPVQHQRLDGPGEQKGPVENNPGGQHQADGKMSLPDRQSQGQDVRKRRTDIGVNFPGPQQHHQQPQADRNRTNHIGFGENLPGIVADQGKLLEAATAHQHFGHPLEKPEEHPGQHQLNRVVSEENRRYSANWLKPKTSAPNEKARTPMHKPQEPDVGSGALPLLERAASQNIIPDRVATT